MDVFDRFEQLASCTCQFKKTIKSNYRTFSAPLKVEWTPTTTTYITATTHFIATRLLQHSNQFYFDKTEQNNERFKTNYRKMAARRSSQTVGSDCLFPIMHCFTTPSESTNPDSFELSIIWKDISHNDNCKL